MPRIRLGTDLSLVGPWDTAHLLEALSPAVLSHHEREPHRARRTRSYLPLGRDLFELSDVEDCDVAVLPFIWDDTDGNPQRLAEAQAFCHRAATAGRPTLIFDQRDLPRGDQPATTVVFRHSLHRSSHQPHEVAIPAWIDDPFPDGIGDGARWSPREYRTVPTVGFCGYAPPLGGPPRSGLHRQVQRARDSYRRARTRLGFDERHGLSPPLFYRADTLRRLQADARIDARFVIRGSRGIATRTGHELRGEALSPAEVWRQYIGEILSGDYVVAVRGDGNYSYRLYETLACGRIPLFVDTDCVLPLQSHVDWQDLVVWTDRREIRHVADRLVRAHQSFGGPEFEARQRRCRAVWERSLSMGGFFTALHQRLIAAVETGPLVGAEGYQRLLSALA